MKTRKMLALLLALSMVLGMFTAVSFADGEEVPPLPTATVTEIPEDEKPQNFPLTFALQFKADEVDEKQLGYYGSWYADFELTVSEKVTFNSEMLDNDTAESDGYLAGEYDPYGWWPVPYNGLLGMTPKTLEAGETVKVMAYAAEVLGEGGLKLTYRDVYEGVKVFNCGIYLTEEFLEANPNLIVTLELRMYNPADETESYVIGKTYTFTTIEIDNVDKETTTEIVADIIANPETGVNETDKETTDAIEAAINSNIDEFTGTTTENISLELKVSIDSIEVDTDAEATTVTSVTYDVTPILTDGETEVEITEFDSPITFRLPVPESIATDQVKVYHEDEELGIYDVEETTDGDKYVEVSSANFSLYTIEAYEAPAEESNMPLFPFPVDNPDWYDIDVLTAKNGTITADHEHATPNSKVIVTAEPDQEYAVRSINVTDESGRAIKVTDLGDGKYSFRMPYSAVTVEGAFVSTCPLDAFSDLSRTAWYHDGVEYCLENGLMVGLTTNTFGVSALTTRAQLVTTLWRLEGEPVVNYAMQFADVPADEYYTEAVRWAAAMGIVSGHDETTFAPLDNITGEQVLSILRRYADYKGVDVDAIASMVAPYDYSVWAENDVIWAHLNGLLDLGTEVTDLTAEATRAEIAAYLYKLSTVLAK